MQRPESDLRFIANQVCELIPRDTEDARRVFELVRELQLWRTCDAEIVAAKETSLPSVAS